MTILNDSPFQLKGSMFTLTVMHLHNASPDALELHLQKLTRESPRLFSNMPIVIDLEHIESDTSLDFIHIDRLLRQHGLIPVGVRHANEQQQQAANHMGLALLNQKPKAKNSDTASKKDAAKPITRPKIISQPVRSGQQIYAKGTDLIILASVSAGSEIIADGHIHVYGTIRGRALAGVQGDTHARIICSTLAPELISIAGRYQTQDQFTVPAGNGPFQVYLDDNQLNCSAI